MIEQIAFSSKLDIQLYHHVRFLLNPIQKKYRAIEISIEYGPGRSKKGKVFASVWARFDDAPAKCFLFETYLNCDVEDYVGVAKAIYDNADFTPALRNFMNKSQAAIFANPADRVRPSGR